LYDSVWFLIGSGVRGRWRVVEEEKEGDGGGAEGRGRGRRRRKRKREEEEGTRFTRKNRDSTIARWNQR
jgi:hypothetical protein